MSGEIVRIHEGEKFASSWRLFEIEKDFYCFAAGIEVKGKKVAGPDTEENIVTAFKKIASQQTQYTCAIKLAPAFGCPPGYKDCENGYCAPKNKKCTIFGCVNLLDSSSGE